MENILSIGFLFISFGSLIYIYLYTNLPNNERFRGFLTGLSSVGILFSIIAFLINKIMADKESNKNTILNNNKLLDSGFTNIEKLFLDYYPYSSELYLDIYKDSKFSKNINISVDDNNKKKLVEIHIVTIMLQEMENILNIYNIDNSLINEDTFAEWLRTWKMWFSSNILKKVWNEKIDNYSKATRLFVQYNLLSN